MYNEQQQRRSSWAYFVFLVAVMGMGIILWLLLFRKDEEAESSQTQARMQIAFSANIEGNMEIYLYDYITGENRNLTNNSYNDELYSWSPDGSQIVFWSDRDNEQGELYALTVTDEQDRTGANLRRLTNNTNREGAAQWAEPEGESVIYYFVDFQFCVLHLEADRSDCIPSDGWGRFKVSPDGTSILVSIEGSDDLKYPHLTNFRLPPVSPLTTIAANSEAWGQNGILLTSGDYPTYTIWSIQPDGSDLRQLTSGNYAESTAIWSPDGSQIAFNSDRDGNREIYIMNPDLTATVAVAVDQAVADMLTAMPPTPNVEATVDAAVVGMLPPGCFMINPPLDLASVHTQPLRDAAELRATLPSLSLVISRLTRGEDIWLELLLLQPGTPVRGWMLVPLDVDDSTLYGGSDCRPEVHIRAVVSDPENN